MSSPIDIRARAESVMARSDQIYIAVMTKSGPHVTPDLFTMHDGRLWCMSAVSTLKSRLLRKDGRAGLLALSGTEWVVSAATAQVLDPARPLELAARPGATMAGALGASRFIAANAAELTGAVAAALRGKLGDPVLPPHRVLIAFDQDALAVYGAGSFTADGWRANPDSESERPARDEDDENVSVPEGLAQSDHAVVGWISGSGDPLALPAAWDPATATATIDTDLFEAVGARPHGAASVTFDTWTGFGPLGKQGVLLRGTGTAAPGASGVEIAMRLDRATYWDGITTETRPL